MLRTSVLSLIILMSSASSAWACSCVGPASGPLADLLTEYTLVYGTPSKTELLANDMPPLLKVYERGDRFNGRTTLTDVSVVGGAFQAEMSFAHPTTAGACMMQPVLGMDGLYLLKKDSAGGFVSDMCINRSLPYGAIHEFYKNGTNPFVKNRLQCPQNMSKAELGLSERTTESSNTCEFWFKDYGSVLKGFRDERMRRFLELSRQ